MCVHLERWIEIGLNGFKIWWFQMFNQHSSYLMFIALFFLNLYVWKNLTQKLKEKRPLGLAGKRGRFWGFLIYEEIDHIPTVFKHQVLAVRNTSVCSNTIEEISEFHIWSPFPKSMSFHGQSGWGL